MTYRACTVRHEGAGSKRGLCLAPHHAYGRCRRHHQGDRSAAQRRLPPRRRHLLSSPSHGASTRCLGKGKGKGTRPPAHLPAGSRPVRPGHSSARPPRLEGGDEARLLPTSPLRSSPIPSFVPEHAARSPSLFFSCEANKNGKQRKKDRDRKKRRKAGTRKDETHCWKKTENVGRVATCHMDW